MGAEGHLFAMRSARQGALHSFDSERRERFRVVWGRYPSAKKVSELENGRLCEQGPGAACVRALSARAVCTLGCANTTSKSRYVKVQSITYFFPQRLGEQKGV